MSLIKLNDRVIIELNPMQNLEKVIGFLNSICSNDLRCLLDLNCLVYTLFLNSTGRFLFDVFITKYYDTQIGEWLILIDCNFEFANQLIAHFNKYKMRTQFECKIESEKWGIYANLDLLDIAQNEDIIIYNDPRHQQMGQRFIIKNTTNLAKFAISDNLETYHLQRLRYLVVDGYYDLQSEISLPINFNLYSYAAISLNKGCYLGQEPTNRFFRAGINRKNLLVCRWDNIVNKKSGSCSGLIPEKNDLIFNNQDGEKIGLICHRYGELLLILLDMDYINMDNDKKNCFLKRIIDNQEQIIGQLVLSQVSWN